MADEATKDVEEVEPVDYEEEEDAVPADGACADWAAAETRPARRRIGAVGGARGEGSPRRRRRGAEAAEPLDGRARLVFGLPRRVAEAAAQRAEGVAVRCDATPARRGVHDPQPQGAQRVSAHQRGDNVALRLPCRLPGGKG